MRKTFAKAVTWRLIGSAEIFAISFWMTGHIATAGHTAGFAAIASFLSYIIHELAWNGAFSRERVAGLGGTVALYVSALSTQIANWIARASSALPVVRSRAEGEALTNTQ
jgi:uncharacterized membrane protein